VLIKWVKQPGCEADLVPELGMKACPNSNSSTPNSVWTILGSDPYLLLDRPVATRLNHGSAPKFVKWIELDQDRFGYSGIEFMGSIIGGCNLFVC
jgi:hypothetical protein